MSIMGWFLSLSIFAENQKFYKRIKLHILNRELWDFYSRILLLYNRVIGCVLKSQYSFNG